MVKIDVDGFEGRAIAGAGRMIASQCTEVFLIEINSEENLRTIDAAMQENGYHLIADQPHYPDTDEMVGDRMYVRADKAGVWRTALSIK